MNMATSYDPAKEQARVESNFQVGYDQLKTLIAACETFVKTDNVKMLHRAHMDMLGIAVRLSQDSHFGVMVVGINEQVQSARKRQAEQQQAIAEPQNSQPAD